jgi:chromosome segregation ATPase
VRIDTIRLSWFRGAGSDVVLPVGGSSIFVFGANGTGKSTFVDGIEVCVAGGKVAHLAHEYSGRHQEKD